MACKNKHSPDKRSAVRELSGTGEAPCGGDEKASSEMKEKPRRSKYHSSQFTPLHIIKAGEY